jgi:ribosomal protein L3 glutamine methyltransferase
MNLADHLERCARALESSSVHFGHGTDNAHDEAAWMLLAVLGLPTDGPLPDPDMELAPAEAARLEALLANRITKRQPLAYLLEEAWFCGLRFDVNADVLVPRSPFAELITREFRPWLDISRVETVLDLCTGSACIAISIAHYFPWIRVDAADVSQAALEVAARNRVNHGLEDRLGLYRSDLFASLGGKCYDLIVTNPPYVSDTERDSMAPEYQAEPALGLFSPGDGLTLPLRILCDAPAYLAPDGQLFCEVGASADRLVQALPMLPFTWLEFEQGGEGVFTIGREALMKHQHVTQQALERVSDVP